MTGCDAERAMVSVFGCRLMMSIVVIVQHPANAGSFVRLNDGSFRLFSMITFSTVIAETPITARDQVK